jgi:hypothetical protein
MKAETETLEKMKTFQKKESSESPVRGVGGSPLIPERGL